MGGIAGIDGTIANNISMLKGSALITFFSSDAEFLGSVEGLIGNNGNL
ncbi:hypothetical protein [Bartonella sp. CB178]